MKIRLPSLPTAPSFKREAVLPSSAAYWQSQRRMSLSDEMCLGTAGVAVFFTLEAAAADLAVIFASFASICGLALMRIAPIFPPLRRCRHRLEPDESILQPNFGNPLARPHSSREGKN
jgi:hypothetical protein